MVRLEISDAGSETGALLKTYLKGRGIYDERSDKVVSYGLPLKSHFKTTLNANAGKGKNRAMLKMREAGVQTVPIFFAEELQNLDFLRLEALKMPMFARQNHGMGGEGMALVLQPEELPWRIAAGYEWFSTFIPVAAEVRVWIFQGEHLDTYEKTMRHPNQYKALGRNFGQGFEFEATTEYKPATVEAAKAVKAVGLDFAAVDVLVGKDGSVYVLEANTAPGVIRSRCQSTLGKLANKIVDWDRSTGV